MNMNSSMKDYLEVVAPKLSPELVCPSTLSKIYTLAQSLPYFKNALLECRLSENALQVDLSVALLDPNINLPNTLLYYPAWGKLQNLCIKWADTGSFLNQRLTEIGLEFDVEEKLDNVSQPCFFLGLNLKAYWNAKTLFEMSCELLDSKVPIGLQSNIEKCFKSLPDGAKIIYVGAMLSRQSNSVRLVVRDIPIEKFGNYLEKIGWIGSGNQIDSVISSICPFSDNIILSFDVGDNVSPRIGLESYLLGKPKDEPRWQLFLDYLIANGLCTLTKSKAILAWLELEQLASNTSSRFSVFIKIVYQPDMSLEAKAYFGFWQN